MTLSFSVPEICIFGISFGANQALHKQAHGALIRQLTENPVSISNVINQKEMIFSPVINIQS